MHVSIEPHVYGARSFTIHIFIAYDGHHLDHSSTSPARFGMYLSSVVGIQVRRYEESTTDCSSISLNFETVPYIRSREIGFLSALSVPEPVLRPPAAQPSTLFVIYQGGFPLSSDFD